MIAIKEFEVTDEHIKLLRAMEVDWDDAEFGAPIINPKRPYGNSDVFKDMFKILGMTLKVGGKEIEIEGSLPLSIVDELFDLHKELEIVLEICLRTGSFEPGIYRTDKKSDDWKRIS